MEENKSLNSADNNFDIAIIGMSCRFPGAKNIDEFWKNLANGVESIARFSDEEIRESGVDTAYLNNPNYVKASPILEGPGFFDAGFFGFTPREAKEMDPQHRILLECAYEALEHAGYDPERYNGPIAVYTGSAMNTYFMHSGLRSKFADEYIPTLIGNDKDFLSTRISYKLNLKGPSINVQTACSTSLVAIHLACQSLISEESDMALAGAISVRVPHIAGYMCDGGGIVSADGHVRAFDANANGTVFGSGGGIIVLKRLSDAIADGDTIHAVIKGSAINNDGSGKVGFTAPSVNSQADVVIEALSVAGLEADTISYVEAHGSGTPVGDPIEIAALTKAFRTFTELSGYCAVGSVKTNVGHLDAAAGIAGIIKTVLSLKYKQIPPSLHYSQPNPEIDFNKTPFYVNSKLSEWKSQGPRRAGVMATGMGGTNAHIILEEATEINDVTLSPNYKLLILSAKTETSLDQATDHLLDYFKNDDQVNIDNVAYTLQVGRKYFDHRKYMVFNDREEAIEILQQEKSKKVFSNHLQDSLKRPVVFLFPGIGDHYVGMAYDLYKNVKFFKEEVDKCAQILNAYLDVDIREIIYPKDFNRNKNGASQGIDLKKMLASRVNKSADENTLKLNKTLYAQPALFTIEYALAKLWMHWGVIPSAIVGHSMGEYVAACLAGVFSLEDALQMITKRAKLVNELPVGSMLAVILSESELLPLLSEDLSISLINGPKLCVVAGPAAAVSEFESVLKEKDIIYRHIQNAHAFHSKMLDPIIDEFTDEVNKIKLNEPQIPYISNVTGTWITNSEATDPAYWSKHANRTARFSDALNKMWQQTNIVLLEIGPGKTLGVLAMQHPESRKNDDPVTISSLRSDYDNQSDLKYLLTSVGKLWLSGIEIIWDKLYEDEKPRRIPLPTYPFQKENYWIEEKPTEVEEVSQKSVDKIKRNDFKDWFYIPSWKRSVKFKKTDQNFDYLKNSNWLIFSSGSELERKVINKLNDLSCKTIIVKKGKAFSLKDDKIVELNHQSEADYSKLFQELNDRGFHPDNILHFWNFDTPKKYMSSQEEFESSLYNNIYSLLFIAKNLQTADDQKQIKIGVITKSLHNVLGDEQLASPEASMILGSARVMNKEIENAFCKCIDFSDDKSISEKQTNQLLSEFISKDGQEIIAYRGNYRWLQTFEQVDIVGDKSLDDIKIEKLISGGVYLITGGTGGLGLVFAEFFAKNQNVKLILVKKSDFPERSQWQKWIKENDPDDRTSKIITKLQQIENLGSSVDIRVCDVSDEIETRSLIERVTKKYGKIDGIIHTAGVVDDGIIVSKTIESVKKVLAAKVFGTINLVKSLDINQLDFFILFSSINSFTAPAGQIDYSAANNYLDAFAHMRNSSKTKIVSINWPGWKETGILANLRIRHGMEKWKEEQLDKAITNNEGVKAISLILNNDYCEVIVSPENFTDLLTVQINQKNTLVKQNENLRQSYYSQRPDLDSNYKEPGDETEKVIANIWQDVLGISQVGIDDNFAELGGHSLLAIQIISRLREIFQVELSIKELFSFPTIIEMAKYIKEKIFSDIEKLSDEEVKELLDNNNKL